MRVCYFGTYRANYARNRIMIEGLRRNGVEVIECHATLWRGVEDRVAAASGRWLSPAFLWRVVRAYTHLIWTYFRTPQHDALVVGYPGQFDVILARILAWLRHVPLVWDILMSIYLVAVERGLDRRSKLTVGLLRRVEWLACRLPDRLILDTEAYMAWFGRVHGVPRSRFRLAPIGADERAHQPQRPSDRAAGTAKVLYYGTFIRNHGVPWIIEAARLLRDVPGISFELIGDGPERSKALELAKQYGLANLVFVPWLEKEALQAHIADADVCLGVFGDTPQSMMTVHNKIYEAMAAARPVVTGDSPAVRAAFQQGEEIYLVARGDARALADAIRLLADDPALRARVAANGHARFIEEYTISRIGERFVSYLDEVVGPRGGE